MALRLACPACVPRPPFGCGPVARAQGKLRAHIAVGCLVLALPAHADVGAAGGLSLLQPLSARTAALAEAVSAEPGRADALGDNPAGLAEQPAFSGSALYHAGFAGDTWLSALGGAPLRDAVAAAGGVALYNGGTVEVLDPTGKFTPVTAQQDVTGRAGLAWRTPVAWGVPFRAGVAASVTSSRLLEDVAAVQLAGDYGVQAAWPATHLLAGVALQHLGGHLRYDREKFPLDNNRLPQVWRFGLAWSLDLTESPGSIGLLDSASHPDYLAAPAATRLGVFAEAQARSTEGAFQVGGGAEFTYADTLALRAGARALGPGAASRLAAVTLGLGVQMRSVALDYAVELLPVAALHRLGLTVRASRPE